MSATVPQDVDFHDLTPADVAFLQKTVPIQAARDHLTASIKVTAQPNNAAGPVLMTVSIHYSAMAAPPPAVAPPQIGTVAPSLQRVAAGLKAAAQKVGVDLRLLCGIAVAESNLDPQAKNLASSAFGLFQFLDGTWVETVAKHGAALGVDASQRSDIAAQCLMGAAFLSDCTTSLRNGLGRPPTDGECYAAHFFGAATALKLLTGPGTQAADVALGPDAQKIINANHSIFMDGARTRTVNEVLSILSSKISECVIRAATLLSLQPAPPAHPGFQATHDALPQNLQDAINHRLDAFNAQSPPTTTPDRVFNAALACENTLVSPFHDLGDGHLACAFAVNRVVEFATGHPVDQAIDTATLCSDLTPPRRSLTRFQDASSSARRWAAPTGTLGSLATTS
jgi:hypothetical protein